MGILSIQIEVTEQLSNKELNLILTQETQVMMIKPKTLKLFKINMLNCSKCVCVCVFCLESVDNVKQQEDKRKKINNWSLLD